MRAINEGEVYRFLLKPCHPKELQMTILQGLQHKKLVAQSRRLLQEHQKTQNLLEELEKANPGITKIDVDEDGAIDMEAYGEGGRQLRGRAVAARRPREGNVEDRSADSGRAPTRSVARRGSLGTHVRAVSRSSARIYGIPMVARQSRAYPPPLQQDAASARFPWTRRNGFLWPLLLCLCHRIASLRANLRARSATDSRAICPGWTTSGPVSIVTDAHSGTKAARIGTAQGGVNRAGTFAVTAGQSLTFNVWAKGVRQSLLGRRGPRFPQRLGSRDLRDQHPGHGRRPRRCARPRAPCPRAPWRRASGPGRAAAAAICSSMISA